MVRRRHAEAADHARRIERPLRRQPADRWAPTLALGKVKDELVGLQNSVIEFCKGKTKNAGDRQRFIAEADARVATAREQGLVINDPRGASHDAKRARR